MKTTDYIRLLYDAAPGIQPAGSGLPPTLTDLDNQGQDQNQPPTPAPTTPATPAPAAEPPATPAAQPPAQPATPVEGVNEDGSLQEGYIKDADGKVTKDLNYKPADAEPPEDATTFWEDVDKLRGKPLPVEYPEGVDPLSPEGAYHREKIVAEQAVGDFEEYLKKADPRGYAYLLHRQAGGSDETFFAQKSFSLPDYETFKDNKDTQISLYKASLINKGLDTDTVQMIVDKAIKDGKLFEVSDAAYKAAQSQHERDLAAIEEQNRKAEAVYKQSVTALDSKLSTAISEGKGMNLIIPDTDKKPFLDFVRGSVEYDKENKQFLIVQPAGGENFNRQLEALYLLFKQGDLSALIKREAQTQNRKRLGASVDKSKGGSPSGKEPPATTASFVPLGSL